MKKKLLFLLFTIHCSLLTIHSFAQYDRAVGFRAGWTTGITYKQFFAPRVAVDGLLGLNHGPLLKGYYIFNSNNHDIRIEIANISFFTGLGAFAWYYKNPKPQQDIQTNSAFLSGIGVMAGVEYKLPRIPYIISVDINPGFVLINHKSYAHDFDWDGGITVSYIF